MTFKRECYLALNFSEYTSCSYPNMLRSNKIYGLTFQTRKLQTTGMLLVDGSYACCLRNTMDVNDCHWWEEQSLPNSHVHLHIYSLLDHNYFNDEKWREREKSSTWSCHRNHCRLLDIFVTVRSRPLHTVAAILLEYPSTTDNHTRKSSIRKWLAHTPYKIQ